MRPPGRMLTAEVHGTEVQGLALCPGRVVRFVMDEQLRRLQVADLLRLTKATRKPAAWLSSVQEGPSLSLQPEAAGDTARPAPGATPNFSRSCPSILLARFHALSSLMPGMILRRQSTTCWNVFTSSSRRLREPGGNAVLFPDAPALLMNRGWS